MTNSITIPDQVIMYEKYSLKRRNYWTGLRLTNKKLGTNWTTYYCLLYKYRNKGIPLDCIMYLLNEFLNWIPAGCWNMYIDCCPVCKCGTWGGDLIKVPLGHCSYECMEKDTRNIILQDQEKIVNIMNAFKYNPEDSIEDLSTLLSEFYDANYYLYARLWIRS